MVVKVTKVLVAITLCLLLGANMWGFLGNLLSGAASLVGGLFGQSNQQKINQANIANQDYLASHAIRLRVRDAQAAGINPLAALGSNFAPGPATQVASDALPNAMSNMGQNLSRAAQAYQDSISRAAELDNQYKQAQIDLTNSETAKNIAASHAALVSQPGTPPGLGVVDASGNPIKTLPRLTKDYQTPSGGRMTLLDPDAQRSVFSGVPGAVLYPWIASELGLANIPEHPSGPLGSIQRYIPDFGNWEF